MSDTNGAFPVAVDLATAELFEQQQRELDKYKTRYLYLPFQNAICAQVVGGYIPAGVIHPVPAPKGKINARLLPEGAQVLQVVSPSLGVPGEKRTAHDDPQIEELLRQIENMRREMTARGQEPPNVAIYLHEVAPIVAGVLSVYGREGAGEIASLRGMPANAFEQHRINDSIFGVESERPSTLAAIVSKMNVVVEQAKSQKGEAARILSHVAKEIIASVERCDRFCREHIRQRHLEMEDPQSDAPKRYSRRDLRAFDLTGQPKRFEYQEQQAEERKKAEAQAAEREQRLIEVMNRREEQMAQVFAEMSQIMKTQAETQKATTEALKAISGKQGK